MKHYVLAFLTAILIGASLAAFSGAASAQKPPPIGAHRHFIMVNDEKVYVGPNFCDNSSSAQGFYGFHLKVHTTDPGLVDVMSEGCS